MKYFVIITILLITALFLIWDNQKENKICDSHKTKSMILAEKPLIKIVKQKGDVFFVLDHPNFGRKQLKSSSILINFFNEVNPLCSNIIYKINHDYFKDAYCFKTDEYNICRGDLLQKGYPVVIQKNNYYSDYMYFLNSYPWRSIEDKIEEIKKDPENINHYKFFINPQIWKLPENSFISEIKIYYNNQEFVLTKNKNEWFLNQKAISPGLAMKFSNEIVMLEEEVNFREPPDKKELTTIAKISFFLDFQNWKYSLFEKKKYDFTIYKTQEPDEYFIEIQNKLIYLKKENSERLFNALNNLINQLTQNQER